MRDCPVLLCFAIVIAVKHPAISADLSDPMNDADLVSLPEP